jgi:hypothetical protein
MALEDTTGDTLSLDNKDATPLRLAKGRTSYNGLSVMAGQITEDCNTDLRWPECITTYKAMQKDATIASTLNLMAMDIAKVKWLVKIPEGHEIELKDRAKFVESVMNDMTHSWMDFIRQAASFNGYGFAPVEKVYRKRLPSQGSKHNDGLYGIKELPLIAQETVTAWDWDSSGRTLTGLYQERIIPKGKNNFSMTTSGDDVFIGRHKFMLFRAGHTKDSPIGVSPLNSVYVAWRYKTELERQESLGVATDVRGLKVIYIPPQYLSESASEEEKQTAEYFKKALSSIHTGEQSGILLPQAFDDNNNKLFEFEVKSVMGTASHDINQIINRYKKDIVVGLLAPMLTIGQDGSGSFALAEVLQNITTTVVEARLVEIRDQLNHDLLPQLFAINGFSTEVMPYLDFNRTDKVSVDDIGKFIQRVAAAGLIKQDADTANWIAEQVGAPRPFDDTDVEIDKVREQMTNFSSNAGEGLAAGGTNGTSSGSSTRDNSTANTEN